MKMKVTMITATIMIITKMFMFITMLIIMNNQRKPMVSGRRKLMLINGKKQRKR